MMNMFWWLVLVLFPLNNRNLPSWQRIPKNYAPREMRQLPGWVNWLDTKQEVDIRIWGRVQSLISEARADGMCLVVSSGYRSYEEQEKLYDRSSGDVLVMKPGYSEHQTGLAVDFQACPMLRQAGSPGIVRRDDSVERPELAQPFDSLPEYQWLVLNAEDYGIVQTYFEEPWHWKFNLKPVVTDNLDIGSNMPEGIEK